MKEPDFKQFTFSLIGLPVSHIWQGCGSVIFIKFGKLSPSGFRKDGSPRHIPMESGVCVSNKAGALKVSVASGAVAGAIKSAGQEYFLGS